MSGFLLDTNCISELVRPKPEPRVLEWMEAANEATLYLSVLTVGEIRKGAARLPQGKRRAALETWLELELQSRFAGRIVPIDAAIVDRWGLIAAQAKRRGKALSVIDGLLTATAVDRNLTVVSRNANDFTNAGVQVLNPWEAQDPGQAARQSKFDVAMGAKTLGWLVMVLVAALAVWWWFDPLGFSQNPVLRWFRGFSVPLPERLR